MTWASSVLVVGLAFAGTPTLAAPRDASAGPEVTLVEFLQRAAYDSPAIHAGRFEIAAAEAERDGIIGIRLGRLQGQMLTGPVPGASGDAVVSTTPVNRPGYIFNDLGPFFRAEIGLTLPLWTFGKIGYGAQAAGEAVDVKKAQILAQKWDVYTQLKDLYYGWLLADDLDGLNDEIQSRLDQAKRYLEEHLTAGDADVTPIDRLKLVAYEAELRTQRIEVKKRKEIIVDGLRRLTGLRHDEKWRPAEHSLTQTVVAIGTLAELQAVAVEHHPDLIAVVHGVRALEAKRNCDFTRFFPDLFITGRGGYGVAPNRTVQKSPFAKDDFNFMGVGVVVGLNFDLQPGVTKASLDKTDAELAAWRDKSRAAVERVLHDVLTALAEVRAGYEKVEANREAFKATRAWSTYALDAFDLGSITARELIDALAAFVKTRFQLLQFVYEYNAAVAQLSRAVGMELQPELRSAAPN